MLVCRGWWVSSGACSSKLMGEGECEGERGTCHVEEEVEGEGKDDEDSPPSRSSRRIPLPGMSASRVREAAHKAFGSPSRYEGARRRRNGTRHILGGRRARYWASAQRRATVAHRASWCLVVSTISQSAVSSLRFTLRASTKLTSSPWLSSKLTDGQVPLQRRELDHVSGVDVRVGQRKESRRKEGGR